MFNDFNFSWYVFFPKLCVTKTSCAFCARLKLVLLIPFFYSLCEESKFHKCHQETSNA